MHGRVALRLVEEVADAARADADEHLDELGAGDAEERHASLAGDGAREERLAGAGRPDQEHAARDARAEGGELLGILQELDDFLELLLGLVDAGDVREGHDRLVAEKHPGAALPEGHRLVIRPLGLPHHEVDEGPDHEEGQDDAHGDADPGVIRDVFGTVDLGIPRATRVNRRLTHVRDDLRQDARDRDRVGGVVRLGHGQDIRLLDDLGDLVGADFIEEGAITLRGRGGRLVEPREEEGRDAEGENEHQRAVAHEPGIQEMPPSGGPAYAPVPLPSIAPAFLEPAERGGLGSRGWDAPAGRSVPTLGGTPGAGPKWEPICHPRPFGRHGARPLIRMVAEGGFEPPTKGL